MLNTVGLAVANCRWAEAIEAAERMAEIAAELRELDDVDASETAQGCLELVEKRHITFATFFAQEGYWRFDAPEIPADIRVVFPNDRQLARVIAILFTAVVDE